MPNLTFRDTSAGANRMQIDNNGYVSFGGAAPVAQLTVNGIVILNSDGTLGPVLNSSAYAVVQGQTPELTNGGGSYTQSTLPSRSPFLSMDCDFGYDTWDVNNHVTGYHLGPTCKVRVTAGSFSIYNCQIGQLEDPPLGVVANYVFI